MRAYAPHGVRNRQEIDMRKLLLASTLALVAGAGMPAAQAADDPPGAAFQDQGIREWMGYSGHRDTSRAPAGANTAYAGSGVYNYFLDRGPARRHVIVRRKHSE